jgi:hypothetical protein
MEEKEFRSFVDEMEQAYLRNYVAKRHLKNHCGIIDVDKFLEQEAKKIPEDAEIRRASATLRDEVFQSLRKSATYDKLVPVLLDLLSPAQG